MSAWIVTKAHAAALVKWYCTHPRASQHWGAGTALDPVQKAALLYAENVRSVNHRYPHHTPDEPEAFTFDELRRAPDLTLVQVIKACHCLEYQSCETDDYRETQAFKLLQQIESMAVRELPGYDAAPWGIDDFGPIRQEA